MINIAQRRKIEAAIRQLGIALEDKTDSSQQYFLQQAAFHLAEARRTGFDHLPNAEVVEYETADGSKLTLDVLYEFDGDGVGRVAAFMLDSKHDIADLLDYDVLVELIISATETTRQDNDYNDAGERFEERRVA